MTEYVYLPVLAAEDNPISELKVDRIGFIRRKVDDLTQVDKDFLAAMKKAQGEVIGVVAGERTPEMDALMEQYFKDKAAE